MKKFCAVILAFCLICALAACGKSAGTKPTPETTVPPASAEVITTVPQDSVMPSAETLYSISMPIISESFSAEDGTPIFSFEYQSMHLIHPDRDVAQKVISDYDSRVENILPEAQQLQEGAEKADHTSAGFVPYIYRTQYNATRIDQGVLSLYGQIVQVGETGRAAQQGVSINYNMVTGDVLTLGSILYHIDFKDELCELLIEALDATDYFLYDDYQQTVRARFARDESTDEAFYFTRTGLCFYFSPYEIAPFVSGNIVAEVPYHQLTGIIGDEFFPAERIPSNGMLSIMAFRDDIWEQYEQFSDIITKENGQKILLTTDSVVQDIRIMQLQWRDDSMTQNTVYAANSICSTDAILLEGDFSEDKPSFMISYYIGGVVQRFYLLCDSQTDSIVLSVIQ